MPGKTPVLLAGATGMLGARIAHGLLAKAHVDLRLLVRKSALATPQKRGAIDLLTKKGAQIAEGDLADPDSLVKATQGVEIVISAVQGLRETIVDGQRALLEAARRNGVRRMLPSDFAIDLFKLEPGSHPMLDWRREADEAIMKSGLEHIHVLNGGFMETITAPFFQMFDFDSRTVTHWGEPDAVFDTTTVEDTAFYTVEAALDRTLPSGKLSVAGDEITVRRAADLAGEAFGGPFEMRRKGSVRELEQWIAATQANDSNFWAPIAAQYQWAMVSGKAKLTELANRRYPQVKPTSFGAFLKANVKTLSRSVSLL